MRMIRPKIVAPQITIAEEQDEFLPVTAALVRHPSFAGVPSQHGSVNTVVVAFRPSEDERARLAAGEDLYISMLTFLRPMQGLIVTVGPAETARNYGVEVEP